MHCPSDGAQLVMSERSGIEIDYCPTCRGVWLDRGELDKIVERSANEFSRPAAPAAPASPPPAPAYPPAPQPGYGYPQQGGYYGKKPKNWLSELFD